MGNKYQRPSGAYTGQAGLNNRSKYIDDATATPRRAISSQKMDGDVNYLIDAVNALDDASGTRASIAERLDVSLNADGTLKVSVAGALDEFIVHQNPGAIARLDNSTFTLAGGDFRALYGVNRRVRVMVGGQPLVGDVASCSFAGGITTVSLVDLIDPVGNLGLISAAPTQVAYGPLTPGGRGNSPRRTEALTFTVGSNTVALNNDAGDLALRHNGSLVARVGAGGLSGLAPASVGPAALAAPVAEALNPVGTVVAYAGSTAPAGWQLCFGQAVSRTTFAALFTVLGTTYGAGDGSTTFNLPDLRGRTPFGLDNMGGTDAGRLNTANTLGLSGGAQLKTLTSDNVTLTVANLPSHSHATTIDSNLASGHGTNTGSLARGVQNGSFLSDYNLGGTTGTPSIFPTASVGSGTAFTVTDTNVDFMPPFLQLNYMIKV